MADEETYNEFSGEEVHHHYHPQGPKRHHYPVHHTRIPADHLESHGNSKLWNDPDYGPMDAEATVPGLSAIGRGPKGDSISATVTSDDDSFVITIYDTDTGEVIGESSNLSAGYITAHQASVTPQPGKATTAYIDVHRGGEVHSYEIKINPGAPGTRTFILPDGVKQRSNRPAETTYACESEDLQCYNMPKFKNAPAPRPGDLVMCILEFLDGSYALAIGTVMSNDHHRVIFLVRTILPTRTPHIESVDGTDWWFIGDVNTNVPATAGDIRDITIEMIGDEEEPYAYAEKNSEDHTVSLYFFLPKSHEYKAGENLELEDYTFDIKEEYTNSVLAQALEAAGNLYSGGDGISIDSDHVVSADETLARSDDVNAAISEASDKLQSEIDNLQNTVDTLEDKDTTYTAGDYIEITGDENAISAELAVKAANEYTDTKAEELQEEIENFNPGEPGVIYTAGNMIDITDNVISVDETALQDFFQECLLNIGTKAAYIEWNDGWDTSGTGIEEATSDRPDSVTFTITNKQTGIVVYETELTSINTWFTSFQWILDDDIYEFNFDLSNLSHYRTDVIVEKTNIILVATYVFDHYYFAYTNDTQAIFFGSNLSETSFNYEKIYEIDEKNTENPLWYTESATSATSCEVFSTFQGAQPISLFRWFYNFKQLTTITGLSNLNTSQVTSMSCMFNNCQVLTELDVSNWDTSQVTDMSYMFNNCQVLTELDVSNWDTSQVTSMYYMFNNCQVLTELDVSNWDTSQVTDMSYMFIICYALTELDVSNWDTSQVTDMSYMFYSCRALTELDVSNWDTSQVTDMSYMFNNCQVLTELDVSNWDTSQVTDMSYMFSTCQVLTELDVSNWDTSQVTDMSYMFYSCYALTTIYSNDSKFVTTAVTMSTRMFYKCSSLIGGNGTKYSSSYSDKSYAHVDTTNNPGYFTEKTLDN